MLNFKDGKKLVILARDTVEKYFEEKRFVLKKEGLNQRRGVFVTIEKFPDKSLRGCIGFPYPNLPLWEGVQRAAFSAAFEDPRFPPLREEEMNKVIFEVSILTEPKLIEIKYPKEYFEKIKIGEDGLIIQNGPFSGLLLPQVPLRYNWDVKEFLNNLCFKAGLTPDFIFDKGTKIWKFQSQIFYEKEPRGKIVELTKHKG